MDAYRRADGERKRAEHLGYRHLAALQRTRTTRQCKFPALRQHSQPSGDEAGLKRKGNHRCVSPRLTSICQLKR